MTLVSEPNPFDTALAVEHSNYCHFDGQYLRSVRAAGPSEAAPLTAFVHDGFRSLVLNQHFPCTGAKSAVRGGDYRFGFYGSLRSSSSCAGLARDLFTFLQDRHSFQSPFSTFIASFSGPPTASEPEFEDLLWQTLQRLHDLDVPHHEWAPKAVADPDDPLFAFSFAETALFIVGLHGASSRAARRFAWPTLIFNPHEQFEHLKDTGRYPRFQQTIRNAEQTLQGDINPMLSAFGERSEASQYSGRQVGAEWRCPFRASQKHATVGAEE